MIDGLGDPRRLVEIAQIVRQVRIVVDAAQVALEVADIDRIEAHQRREQPPVRLGLLRAHEVTVAAKLRLEIVECREQLKERFFVGRLRGREAGTVDAVVHALVDPLVDAIDVGAQPRAG